MTLLPGPDDINWQTINYRTGERRRKSCLVLPLILIVVCLPTGVFTGVARLITLARSTSSAMFEPSCIELNIIPCRAEYYFVFPLPQCLG
jgi:hypothetical protein